MSADTPRRLGRGLEALLATAKQQREPAPEARQDKAGDFRMVQVADVRANHFQPRRVFPDTELSELATSIGANGLLQPITVRHIPSGGWELVAGERRLRAVTRLGWTQVPAYVRDFDDKAMLTLALVENLQRSDLNALEEAEGYLRLQEEFGLSQQQVADAVGKDRSTIANLIRILALPDALRRMVEEGHLSPGHGRALLAIKDERRQTEIAREIVAKQLSVRDVERLVRGAGTSPRKSVARGSKGRAGDESVSPAQRRIEEELRRRFQTDVSVESGAGGKGTVRISYYSADDLERLLELMIGPPKSDFE